MNVNVISKTDNALLGRKEIEAEVSFDGPTPPRAELRNAIAAKVGASPDLTVLSEVNNSFGTQSVKVMAHAYAEKEQMLKTEPEHIVKRDKLAEEAKPKEEAKPAEAPKEEAKPEEKPKDAGEQSSLRPLSKGQVGEPKAEEKPKEEKPETEKPAEAPKEKAEEKPKEEKPAEEKKPETEHGKQDTEKPAEEAKAEEKK